MAFRDRIEIVVDFVTGGAQRSLGSLRTDMAKVDGAVGKMKVAGQTALDGIKANAIGFATAAGAAIAGFAANAITQFQDLALAADAFATKTGLSADEASRLMEVAGDLGVPLDAVETSLGKMNLTADNTPGKFDEIGAAIVRNKDGTINVKDTFLAVVDALNGIPDAATRAGAAQEIFGRGWGGMATLIALSADDLVTAMGNVSDAKVIDEEEVGKAKDLRDAMDDLKGKLEDATLELGEALVPALKDAVENLTFLIEAADKLGLIDIAGEVASWANPIGAARNAWDLMNISIDKTTQHMGALGDPAHKQKILDQKAALHEVGDEAEEAADDIDLLREAYGELTGKLENREAYLRIEESFGALKEKAIESFTAAAEGTMTAEEAARDYELALIDQKQKVIEYATEVLALPPEQLSKVMALLDQGKLDEAEAALTNLARSRDTTLNIYPILHPQRSRVAGGAQFSDSGGFQPYGSIVAERRPEIVNGHLLTEPTYVPGPVDVVSGAETARMLAGRTGGSSTTIHNYWPAATSPVAVARAQAEYRRRNGTR